MYFSLSLSFVKIIELKESGVQFGLQSLAKLDDRGVRAQLIIIIIDIVIVVVYGTLSLFLNIVSFNNKSVCDNYTLPYR